MRMDNNEQDSTQLDLSAYDDEVFDDDSDHAEGMYCMCACMCLCACVH